MKAARMTFDEAELTVVGLARTRLLRDLQEPDAFLKSLEAMGPKPPKRARADLKHVARASTFAMMKVSAVLNVMDNEPDADCGDPECSAHDALRARAKVEIRPDDKRVRL